MPEVTILPSPLDKKPTRNKLVGLFYHMLFTDLAPFLSVMPKPICMPLDDAEHPLSIRDLTEVEKGQLKYIYPDHSFIFCLYWGVEILVAGTSRMVNLELNGPGGQRTFQKVL